MPKRSSPLLELAKRGAEARFRELAQEARYLLELFPHLKDAFDKDELPIAFVIARNSGSLKRTGRTGRKRRRPGVDAGAKAPRPE